MENAVGSYGDIVILALIAVFIALRLRSILGQKNDGDESIFRPKQQDPAERDPIIQIGLASQKPRQREQKEAAADTYASTLQSGPVADGIALIKTKDPLFSASAFLDGAKMAFEMVFDAFAKGDKQTLAMLLSDDIYQHFLEDLNHRDTLENKPETTLLAVKTNGITSVTMDKNTARIAVQFVSEQVTVERDSSGAITGGDPSEIHHSEDEWMFERDITSKNPNWKVIET